MEGEGECRTHEPYRASCHDASLGRTKPHAMGNECKKGLPMVGVDLGHLWCRSAETAGNVLETEEEDDDGDPPDCVKANQS